MTLAPEQNPVQIFPEDILTNEDPERQWRIAHTKSRREKALANFLFKHNIAYYVPMLKIRQPNKNRVRYSYKPVFSGYIFFKATINERYLAISSNQIANVIDVRDEFKLCRELEQIKNAISLEAPLYPYECLQEGEEVIIKKGPFKGIQGIVVKKKNNYKLLLKVSSIFQSLAMDIDANQVEPLSGFRQQTNQGRD